MTDRLNRVLFDMLIVNQLVKKFPTVYGIQMLITVFSTGRRGHYPEPD